MSDDLMSFHLDIVSPEDDNLFSGRVRTMQVSGSLGMLGIRHGHAPLLSEIKPGPVYFTELNGKEQVIYIDGGFIEVTPSTVTIMAETAIRGDSLDEARLQETMREAKDKINLMKDSSNKDYVDALAELCKATAKLRVAQIQSKLSVTKKSGF